MTSPQPGNAHLLLGATPVPLGAKQWADLRHADPADVCNGSRAVWNKEGFYSIRYLGNAFLIFPTDERVESPAGDQVVNHPEFRLLLLCYLLGARDIPPQSRWVSEKELTGGSLFFTGPHVLPTQTIARTFGTDTAKYLHIGKSLGGLELPGYGDAALVFELLPRIRCVCVLWAQDEEFTARASFLFDASVERHLALDVINLLVKFLVKKLVRAAAA